MNTKKEKAIDYNGDRSVDDMLKFTLKENLKNLNLLHYFIFVL